MTERQTVLRKPEGKELTSNSKTKGLTPWIPCYIPSVERLILPICRIGFLICSEGFSCQNLNVLKPDRVMSSGSGSIISLTVGRKKRKRHFRDLPVTNLTFAEIWKLKHLKPHMASNMPKYMPQG